MKTKYFGKNLKNILSTLGLSQVELSKKAKVTPACISQIINGTREPCLTTIIKIMNATGASFEALTKQGN